MARETVRKGQRHAILRSELMLRHRNSPQFGVRAEWRYWMASLGALFSVALDDADRPDERAIVRRWNSEEPGLLERHLPAERGLVTLERVD